MSMTGFFFIVGNSRNDAPILERVFGNRSEAHTFGELHFVKPQLDSASDLGPGN